MQCRRQTVDSERHHANDAERIHFEDFDGVDFERLVFAHLLRAGWSDLAWFGQTGSDLGRDIIGQEPVTGGWRRTVVQCVNRASLTKSKTERDMERAAQAPSGIPQAMRFICRSNVSSERRDQVRTTGARLGIAYADVWSGVEFEEHLRRDGEQLLKRFVEGVVFPDDPQDLRRLVDDHPELSDADMLTALAAVLDRPALRTPFMIETQLPAFEQAIGDTIEAFNTGLWRARDGSEIRRVPSRHHIRSVATRRVLDSVVASLDEVRRAFQRGLASGDIRPCGCSDAGCHMFEISSVAARALDAARLTALSQFASVHPAFQVRVGWMSSLYKRMREHGTLTEPPGDIPDAPFALASTVNWMHANAILVSGLGVTFTAARAFYQRVQRKPFTEPQLNSVLEQLLFSLNQIAALRALAAAPNKADVARVGIVAWYYAVYGAASAMIAAADGSFPETHATTALQWDSQFAAPGLAMAPFSDRLGDLVAATVEAEMAGPRARGRHPLTMSPSTLDQAWGCHAEYLSGTAGWEQWNLEQRVRRSPEFRALGVDNLRRRGPSATPLSPAKACASSTKPRATAGRPTIETPSSWRMARARRSWSRISLTTSRQ